MSGHSDVTDVTEDDASRYRLPRTATPSRYDLLVETDLETSAFHGSVAIGVTVHEPTRELVLNAADLDVGPGSVETQDGRILTPAAIDVDGDTERVSVSLDTELEPGAHVLHLDFAGKLNERLLGYYRSAYRDDDGTEHVVATTHFEPTDARRAFPCWDEPDLKAPFAITLVVDEDLVALANGPEIGREPAEDGRVRVRFAETMPMSTYLVAYCVGRLEITEPVDVDGVPLRIAHVPGKGYLTAFALDSGAFSLRFFADYYGIPYADAKVDFIALPDFAQGAMENLGLITYRENLVLVDPERATQYELDGIADVIAHELAHMWFGDLVTMRWWNGLWLNEAFATFMALLAVDAYRPDWDVWGGFRRTCSYAFDVDALNSTRSIEYPVRSPDDAQGMFDTLTYTKGAAVLRMLEQYIGPDVFRDGIRRYLREHAHGNTETQDLWDALGTASGVPVGRVMDGWIWQGGYPTISIEPSNGKLRLTQERFRLEGGDDGTRWDVPLVVRASNPGAPRERVLVPPDGTALAVEPDTLLVANAGEASFVRLRYEGRLVDTITESLWQLDAIERYGLVDDAWAAVIAGTQSVDGFLGLLERFRDEDDLHVWQVILGSLSGLERCVEARARDGVSAFTRDLTTGIAERLGPEPGPNEPDLIRSLRGSILSSRAVLGRDPDARDRARNLEAAARAGEDVDAALAAAAVVAVAASGDSDDYERFLAHRRVAATPQEQLRYLYALSDFRVAELVERTVRMAFTDEVRPQNGPSLLARAIANREVGALAWRLVKQRWDEVNQRFAPTTIIYLAEAVRLLTAPELERDVQAFFAEHPIKQSRKMLEQILERQRIAVAMRARVAPQLESRFS